MKRGTTCGLGFFNAEILHKIPQDVWGRVYRGKQPLTQINEGDYLGHEKCGTLVAVCDKPNVLAAHIVQVDKVKHRFTSVDADFRSFYYRVLHPNFDEDQEDEDVIANMQREFREYHQDEVDFFDKRVEYEIEILESLKTVPYIRKRIAKLNIVRDTAHECILSVYPRCDLGSLRNVLQTHEFTTSLVTKKQWMNQIRRVLREIHFKNIVHSHLTSSNIFLSYNINSNSHDIVIGGWDAAYRNGTAFEVSSRRMTVESFQSMAPELFNTTGMFDATVDTWSFGCLILEILFEAPVVVFRSHPQDQYNETMRLAKAFMGEEVNESSVFVERAAQMLGAKTFDLVKSMLRINPQERIRENEWINLGQ